MSLRRPGEGRMSFLVASDLTNTYHHSKAFSLHIFSDCDFASFSGSYCPCFCSKRCQWGEIVKLDNFLFFNKTSEQIKHISVCLFIWQWNKCSPRFLGASLTLFFPLQRKSVFNSWSSNAFNYTRYWFAVLYRQIISTAHTHLKTLTLMPESARADFPG